MTIFDVIGIVAVAAGVLSLIPGTTDRLVNGMRRVDVFGRLLWSPEHYERYWQLQRPIVRICLPFLCFMMGISMFVYRSV